MRKVAQVSVEQVNSDERKVERQKSATVDELFARISWPHLSADGGASPNIAEGATPANDIAKLYRLVGSNNGESAGVESKCLGPPLCKLSSQQTKINSKFPNLVPICTSFHYQLPIIASCFASVTD